MSIRVNTLGKSAIINRQLNTAYDIVEYVADNLPLLMDLCKKLDSIKLAQDAYTFINHIDNKCIHLSKEQVELISKIADISSSLEINNTDINHLTRDLQFLVSVINKHIDNKTHITPEERDKWNSIELPELSKVATTGSYNDLTDKPEIKDIELVIDTELSNTSNNPVQNKVISKELDKLTPRTSVSRVGFTGKYSDLVGIPRGDTMLNTSSNNWVTNKTITNALNELSNSIENVGTQTQTEALTEADIDEVLNGE